MGILAGFIYAKPEIVIFPDYSPLKGIR